MGLIMRKRKCYTGKVKEQPVYSTDEICIGYIDINGTRKKLYRKIITGTTASTASAIQIVSVGVTMTWGQIVGGEIKKSTDACMPLNFYNGSSNWGCTWLNCKDHATSPNSILINIGANDTLSKPFEAIIEYTKD